MYKMHAILHDTTFRRQHRASSIGRVCHHVGFLLVIACHTYKERTLSARFGEGRSAEAFARLEYIERLFSTVRKLGPGLLYETRNLSNACRFHRRFLRAFEQALRFPVIFRALCAKTCLSAVPRGSFKFRIICEKWQGEAN